MHPFCCVPPIPVSPAASTAAAANSHPTSPMPPSPPQPPAARSNSISSAAGAGDRRRSLTQDSLLSILQGDVKLNEIVGGGISGILYKWVNYGKGWRPRWFALNDGVLSYYKIEGPDRIELTRESEKASKVINEGLLRRQSRRLGAGHGNGHQQHQKPIGEIHLKVASIRESRSDDRKFYIFSGTKTVQLRAENAEDRASWMEALRATKEMFPRLSTSEMVGPGDTAAAAASSTERLRQRLLEEGVSETAIADSENIVRSEFASLHAQLALLKQKQAMLIDTLRQLETEKVDLENTLVDESQMQSKEYGSASRSRHEKYSGMIIG